ncbi:hypothetical protein [Aestuariivirga sp.]|uniref:hypothetical protein n=1 Tax=Aestuariivirga sp. TaxID=2650926 RepID=UPI0039E48C95
MAGHMGEAQTSWYGRFLAWLERVSLPIDSRSDTQQPLTGTRHEFMLDRLLQDNEKADVGSRRVGKTKKD